MQRRRFITRATAVTALAASTLETTANSLSAHGLPTERTDKGFVVKAGQSRFGEKTRLGGTSPNNIKISMIDTGGNLSVFEYIGKEKGGPPLHIHPSQDEIFHVIEGTYLFEVGGEKHKLTAGETIFLPRKVSHTFAQLTDTGKLIFFFQPSGQMEDFFRKAGSFPGEPSPQEGAKLFAAHGLQVVGPPLIVK